MGTFIALFLQLLPYLPAIIKFVEQLHGPGNGAAKLATAVNLMQQLAPEIAPHLTSDPAKLDAVQKVIGVSVAVLNATGQMPTAEPKPSVQSPLQQPAGS